MDISTSTEWTGNDTHSCMVNCGVLDGPACPLYQIRPETVNAANETERVMLETAKNHRGIELSHEMMETFHIEKYGKIYAPDIFLFSLFLAIGTLAISFTLKGNVLFFLEISVLKGFLFL